MCRAIFGEGSGAKYTHIDDIYGTTTAGGDDERCSRIDGSGSVKTGEPKRKTSRLGKIGTCNQRQFFMVR